MASEATSYTKIYTADNMEVCDSLENSQKPNNFVCVLNPDNPGSQMDLRLDSMVKMYLDPVSTEVGGE